MIHDYVNYKSNGYTKGEKLMKMLRSMNLENFILLLDI